MKFFVCTIEIFLDEYRVLKTQSDLTMGEVIPEDSELIMTPSDFWDWEHNPFLLRTNKKGQHFIDCWDGFPNYPKEKLHWHWGCGHNRLPCIDDAKEVRVISTYRELPTPSFERIMRFPADQVVAYLKENGITYCPAIK